jgi:3-isopropylmalate/(R)-2-methylmalate dehydratase large subunit
VTSKDIALFIIGQLGADGGLYASIEFHGQAITQMSMDSRFVLPNMMAEMGAKNAWVVQDEVTLGWLAQQGGEEAETRRCKEQRSSPSTSSGTGAREQEGRRAEDEESKIPPRARKRNQKSKIAGWEAISRELAPDSDATYLAEYEFNVAAIEPQIACPHDVDNVKPLSAVAGTKIDQAFIGTCTNGRLEDIAVAAQVMAGRRVALGTRLLIIPASSQVYLDAVKAGYVETLLLAGATFGSPGCGPCMGNHMGIPAPGEVTISSANRNFRGRMGTREAEIYLAAPAIVAASAVAGRIAGPEQI